MAFRIHAQRLRESVRVCGLTAATTQGVVHAGAPCRRRIKSSCAPSSMAQGSCSRARRSGTLWGSVPQPPLVCNTKRSGIFEFSTASLVSAALAASFVHDDKDFEALLRIPNRRRQA